ncbi:MAG: hypothetical protein CBB71_05430 [Rhodopirellula sp. TMED11]|nr:MAG: hypothetical protein CBB71_05430 [Rhodopirellula sp. TMED11]
MRHSNLPLLAPLAASFVFLGGCRREYPEPEFAYAPNVVQVMKYEITDELSKPQSEQALSDTAYIVEKYFGTAADPKLPNFDPSKSTDPEEKLALTDLNDLFGALTDVVSLERMKPAVGKDGLYQQLCAKCHGTTGDGRGELAAISSPYPRDYRLGVFKFKDTARNAKPSREDLASLIHDGIPGTPMTSIKALSNGIVDVTDEDIQALVDYVIYLSMRGQFERDIVALGVLDGILASDYRLYYPELDPNHEGQSVPEKPASEVAPETETVADAEGEQEVSEDEELEIPEPTLEDFQIADAGAQDIVAGIADDWLSAADMAAAVPAPPEGIPVADSHAEFVALSKGDQAEALAKSVARGHELFLSNITGCNKCHGPTGKGDGGNKDYDDWTKDWTMKVGIDPQKHQEKLVPLMARGALPPRFAMPRDFTVGVFRGGEKASDLYRRITQGIPGSPMPSATFVPGKYEQQDVWHLINFIRSLKKVEEVETAPGDDTVAQSE